MLRVAGVRRRFGELQAVDDVSFEVAAGETYGLLGPNGAGKTTTIRVVVGLLRADAGTVTLDGEPVGPDTREVRRRIGYVPQELALYPDLTARENLRFFARVHGMGRDADRIDEVLEVTALSDRADDRVDEFSGGMQRRLNIGIGLLHRPSLLVLDEPTVGVDPQSRDAILASVEALAGAGVSVLYTTHYMEEAERLCDRVGVIDRGRVVAEGTRRELVATVGEQDRVTLVVAGDADAAADAVRARPGVTGATAGGDRVTLTVTDAGSSLPGVLAAVGTVADVRGVTVEEPDLEAVFLHLTGRALRD